jgi:hypothetical protein
LGFGGGTDQLMRWQIGTTTPPIVVATMPDGYGINDTFTFVNASSNDDVYFDRYRTSGNLYGDIYYVPTADTA